jgi:phosphonate transport system ATP-binding protein
MSLVVDGLSKYYGETCALDDVSFEVPDGEFTVVLGESGAGKSTLLRILNGLTEPTSGTVRLDGDSITMASRGDVGMVFQQHNLVEDMSAFGNALTGSLDRWSFLRSLVQWQDIEEKRRALAALDTVGLLDEADQQVASMSGGQQQRVGIARALVQEPALLLADEPVASLDPSSAETVMQYLRVTAVERDLTTLASLHQVNIARQFGQRFIGLRDGEKVFDGRRDELTAQVIDDIYGGVETDEIRAGGTVDDETRPGTDEHAETDTGTSMTEEKELAQ